MRWGLVLFWAVVIAILHTIPGQDLDFIQLNDLFQLDKLFHLWVFAIGAWLLVRVLQKQYANHAFRYTFITYAIYGILLELMQGAFFEGRHADFFDWIADVAGVILALWLYQKIYPNETIKS